MALRSPSLVVIAVLAGVSSASAKDPVAGQSGPRTPAELCCVAATLLPPIETSPAPGAGMPDHQVAPISKAEPGLDAADWNCRRPDGSQRCVSELQTNR